jgi:hypothetical protein
MKTIFAAACLHALAFIIALPCGFAITATVAQAEEPRFDFTSRQAAEASYKRVFAQFSPAGSRAFDRDVKKLVIIQFSPDGTVSGGRAAIRRKKPTPAEYYAAMSKALDGKTAAEVVAIAERIAD